MKTNYDFPSIGCYVDASALSADDCNKQTIAFAESYGFISDKDDDYLEWLSEIADEAIDFLNELETRPFMSWVFEDNSLFLMAHVDSARENCEFVSSKTQDYPPEDYRGEWLHVNDHGNCALYVRGDDGQDKEIWSCV